MPADHSIRHRDYVEGCYLCRLRSVSVAASATPSRAGGKDAASKNDLVKQWDRDIPAYKRLVKDGVQPETVDGAADLEAKLERPEEVGV